MAQLRLAGPGQSTAAVGINQQQRIVILAKGRRANVTHQQRNVFAHPLGTGVGQQVVTLSSKAHTVQLPLLGAITVGHGGQNVGVFDKGQAGHGTTAVFFDFFSRKIGRTPICNCGSSYENRDIL